MDLQVTNGYFNIKGEVVGIGDNSQTSGSSKNGQWKKIIFGIQIAKHSIVYVELFGNKSEEIKMFSNFSYKKSVDKDQEIMIQWEDRNKLNNKSYKFQNEVTLQLTDDQEYARMIAWDAIEYIEDNVKNGIKLQVKGKIKIEKYNGKIQKFLNIQEIYKLEDDQEYGAFFNQKIISNGLLEDRIIDARIISKKRQDYEIVPLELVIGNSAVLEHFKNNDTIGKTFFIHGAIKCGINIVNIEGNDFISSNYEYFKVLGGSLDNNQTIVYDINDLDLIEKNRKEQDLKNSQNKIDDDVNAFGF